MQPSGTWWMSCSLLLHPSRSLLCFLRSLMTFPFGGIHWQILVRKTLNMYLNKETSNKNFRWHPEPHHPLKFNMLHTLQLLFPQRNTHITSHSRVSQYTWTPDLYMDPKTFITSQINSFLHAGVRQHTSVRIHETVHNHNQYQPKYKKVQYSLHILSSFCRMKIVWKKNIIHLRSPPIHTGLMPSDTHCSSLLLPWS